MSRRTNRNGVATMNSVMEETVAKLMPTTVVPPLLPPETTPPHSHTWSSTRTLRPRPPRPAISQKKARTPRKRVHMQEEDVVHERQLPCKRGKTGGTNAGTTVGGSTCAGATGLGAVAVKEEVTSRAVGVQAMVGAVGSRVGGSMAPTRGTELQDVRERDDAVKVEVKVEVKEECSDDEDDEDGEYYSDDEDNCGSGDTGEDSDGDTARVKTEIKREVKREVKAEVRRDMEERVEEDVSRGTVQLSATQSDTDVRTRRNLWVTATNPHGFMPATLARLQALSPEARERKLKKLLKQRERVAKRLSDPAVRQMARVRQKERYENREKEKQRNKEYREKNKEKVKQQNKEWREKNKDKIKQYSKEYCEKNREMNKQRVMEYREKHKDQVNARQREKRARKKAEREAAQRAATGDSAESV